MREIKLVLATVKWDEEHLQQLRNAFKPAEVICVDSKDHATIESLLQKIDVAVLASDLDERFLKAPNLKWVHCDHAGLDKSAKREVFEKNLIVTSSAGRSAPALAEHALFFMLALTYRFVDFYNAQRAHQWGIEGQNNLRGLCGKTLGIIGLGNTGTELAKRAKAMDMKVLAYRRRNINCDGIVDKLYSRENNDTIDELLMQSDYVVLALPLSDATHHLIGERELKLMKPTAYLINMARGAVVDEKALVNAVLNKEIAGAGLDTFAVEPLPPESPLWDLPNVLITPHVTPQVPDRTGRSLDIIRENIRRYRAGEPMLNQLTIDDVYTKRT